MEKISEMIKRMCPEGVERVPFEECASFIRGITYNKKQESTNETLSHKVLRANNITLGTNCINFNDVKLVKKEVTVRSNQWLIADDILICAGSGSKEHVGKVAFIEKDIDYTFGGFMAVIRTKTNVLPRYLFHILISNYFKEYLSVALNSTTINNLSLSVMAGFEIPLPPLPIQQEIVRILDSFTQLQSNLEAELVSRQKQYEFYRNKLLTFDKDDKSVEWKAVKDIFETRNGYTPSTNNPIYWDEGCIPWFKMEDIREKGHILSDSNLHITNMAIKGKGLFKANSIILATSATIGEHALILTEHLSNQRFTNFYPNKCYVDRINMKYMHYYFFIIDKWCKEHTIQGSFAGVNMTELYHYTLPIPSKDRQQEIVSILDTFESLITNLKKEIEARKKQYEYYREQLLTFE